MAKFKEYNKKQKYVLKNANSRWNLLTGAVRSGKSYIGDDLIIKRLEQLPDGRRALIGKTETTIMRNILDPLQDKYGDKFISDIQGKKREAVIFGKKFYCIGANDARATKKLQGAGLIYAFGDEITTWPEEFFNMLKSRLSDEGAMFDGSCNPAGPYHWLKKTIIDVNDLDVFHQHFTIDDNKVLSKHFVEELKKEYIGVWYQRYVKGLWVLAEGLVYPFFNDENLIDVSDMPKMINHWIGCDYGTSNDTVFQLIGLGQDYKLYVIDEWRWGSKNNGKPKTDVQLREALQDFIFKHQVNPQWIVVDPSAKSFITELYQHRDEFTIGKYKPFANISPAKNDVSDGIRLVSSVVGANKLIINRRLDKLIQEFNSYSWDSKQQEKGQDKPIKKYDHGLDALRYVLFSNYNISKRVLRAGG